MSTFGIRLRKARKDKGMTQTDLGIVCVDRYGNPATHSTISQYEKGLTTPTVENLISMAKALEVSIDWLLGASGSPTGHGFSLEAMRLAREYDKLPKAGQDTLMRCLDWTNKVGKKKPVTATEIVQVILSDKTIPR